MSAVPPRLLERLLRACLPPDVVGASIAGDLREEYARTRRWRRARYLLAVLPLAVGYGGSRTVAAIARARRSGDPWQRRRPLLRTLADDLRDGWRGLRRRPGFAAAGIGLLACGLTATTIVASFVDAVFVRPLPLVPDGGAVVRIQERVSNPGPNRAPVRNVTAGDIDRIAAAAPSLAATAALLDAGSIPISTPDGASRIPVIRATSGFFDVAGVRPAAGRAFTADDERAGAARVAVLSHAGWRRLFGGREDAIGSTVILNRQPHTVIGVMPQGFVFPSAVDAYVPLVRDTFTNRFHVATGLARLRPGVPLERARAEVEAALAGLAAEEPGAGHGDGARVLPWRDVVTERVRPAFRILTGAAMLVLLLAIANLAGLLADRTTARTRELVVRRSLGATNGAVARLLIAEGAILGLGGALLALAASAFTLRAIVALSPEDLPFREAVRLDVRVLVVTALVAVAAGMGAGLLPALRLRRRSLSAGERSGPGAGIGRSVRLLVAAQIAAAMVLVSGAGLLIRSFVIALRTDPGVRVEGILVAGVSLNRYDEARQRSFFDRTLEELRRTPGVARAELMLWPPLRGSMPVTVSTGPGEGAKRSLFLNAVTPGALPLVSLPLVEGRGVEAGDDERSEKIALLSRMAATQLFPGQSPLGRTIYRDEEPLRIVGVVGDARQEGALQEPRPMIYVPFRQMPFGAGTFVIATDIDPGAVFTALRATIRRLDPDLPLDDAERLTAVIDADLAQPRFYSVVVGVFGAGALGLAVAGLYAVIAFITRRRMFEFGVRSALGARPVDNLWMVYREGLVLAAAGVAAGLVAAVEATQLLRSLLYGLPAGDPMTLGGAAVLTLAVALAAVLTPAIRAARVDPVTALRVE